MVIGIGEALVGFDSVDEIVVVGPVVSDTIVNCGAIRLPFNATSCATSAATSTVMVPSLVGVTSIV